jgi:hypothetical protein
MSEDSFLRQKAREVIEAGNLPNRSPDHMWGGPGTGARCAVCGASMKHGDVELEIEFVHDDCPDSDTYHVHLRCFSILERERQYLSTETVSARAQMQSAGADAMAGGPGHENGA